MITRAQVDSLGLATNELTVGALADLQALLDSLAGVDPVVAKGILFEAFPQVFDPYALAVSNVSTTFYEELRAEAGVKKAFTPTPLVVPVQTESWKSLVGFGTRGSMFEQGGTALIFSLLSGGLTKRLTEAAADTIATNASHDPVKVSYQRVPAAGCCAFCALLASRGAVYSKNSALKVAGRGLPISKNYRADGSRKSGGQARGVRTRGSRPPGESFHDNCKCKAVPVFADNEVQLAADADAYYEQYREASDKIRDGLKWKSVDVKATDGTMTSKSMWVHNEAGPVTSRQEVKMIMANLRQELGMK